MFRQRVIVIGASAGGVETLTALVRQIPPGLPAAVFVVIHFPSHATSVLPVILSRAGPLQALHPRNGEPIESGKIYVAPPNWHLLLGVDTIHIAQGPREHGFRPAIDPLFRSAASAFGPQAVGIVLSGTLGDGTSGLLMIKEKGGITIAQDPEDALFPSMPLSAIAHVNVDYILPVSEMPEVLKDLAYQPVFGVGGIPVVENTGESERIQKDIASFEDDRQFNSPTVLTCPDCGGVLWELAEKDRPRYRCHAGHSYSEDSLLLEQTNALESALWVAVRSLEERAALAGRLSSRARQRGQIKVAENFNLRREDAEQNADLIRQVLMNGKVTTGSEPAPELFDRSRGIPKDAPERKD